MNISVEERGLFMRWLLAMLFFVVVLMPAQAQRDYWYQRSEAQFLSLDVETRLFLQKLMTAAGHWNAVHNVGYSTRFHAAIQSFQRSIGRSPTGLLTVDEFEILARQAEPVLDGWDIHAISHPERERLIWVPLGLGLWAERIENGVLLRENNGNRFRIKYEYFPHANVRTGYGATLREMRNSGDNIIFDVLRDDFFVISSNQGRFHRYVRYHRDGSGLLGFDMNWSTEAAPVYGERLAALISGSLWAEMTGAQRLPMDVSQYPWEQVARAPAMPSAPEPRRTPTAPLPAPQTEAPKRNEEQNRGSSGSGFFVTSRGHVVTNHHVIDGCSAITVASEAGAPRRARLVAENRRDDLALLMTDLRPQEVAGIRVGARLGETVAIFGYPLSGLLSTSGNFTLGNITALSGLRDDATTFQISAPVQPGNSGGPLLDENGNVIGVVVAKLNAIRTALATGGDIPQNVNFAIKGEALASFLGQNGLVYSSGLANERMPPADLADRAKRMSVHVACR